MSDKIKGSRPPENRIKAEPTGSVPSIGSRELEGWKDRYMDNILRQVLRPTHTIILGERRNEVLGERFTTREYLTPQGKIVEVKTIMEMEFVKNV